MVTVGRFINGVKVSDATVSYLETALWSSSVMLPVTEDELVDGYMDVADDHPLHGISENDDLDEHFDITDISKCALRSAEKDVNGFFDDIEELGLLDQAREYADDGNIAHDFWLTRNGHGAGFWDGDYGDSLGKKLTDIAKKWGEINFYVDIDGKVYEF